MSAHVPIGTNRRKRIGVALIALAAMAMGIAPVATSATGVSAAEPSAATEPVIVDGELSLEVDGTIARPEGVGVELLGYVRIPSGPIQSVTTNVTNSDILIRRATPGRHSESDWSPLRCRASRPA